MALAMSEPEMTILKKFQDKIHKIDPKIRTEIDPDKHEYFRKEMMQFRDELRDGHLEFVMIRRAKLKRLLIADVTQEMRLMRHLGHDYIPTHP